MRTAFRFNVRRPLLLLAGLSLLTLPKVSAATRESRARLVCRPEMSVMRREELADRLRVITGWPALHFDDEGVLRFGDVGTLEGGSQTARALLKSAAEGDRLIVFEDASGSAEVVFCRVLEGHWRGGGEGKPPTFIVQIDFADFARVSGDRAALAAFNAGWGALHEIEHVVDNSPDAEGPGAAGDCEQSINLMRRELGLAERAEYFHTPMPGSERGDFPTRYVRLAFERRRENSRPKRYWLFWDANVVGGWPPTTQVAATW